jgi:hypothetical protein
MIGATGGNNAVAAFFDPGIGECLSPAGVSERGSSTIDKTEER